MGGVVAALTYNLALCSLLIVIRVLVSDVGSLRRRSVQDASGAWKYPDPRTGDPINFNFLPTYADPGLGVMPHTVQVSECYYWALWVCGDLVGR
jgi:hypothetical protein